MASGESLNKFSTDLLTPLWKATSECTEVIDSPEGTVDKNTKSTGYGVRTLAFP